MTGMGVSDTGSGRHVLTIPTPTFACLLAAFHYLPTHLCASVLLRVLRACQGCVVLAIGKLLFDGLLTMNSGNIVFHIAVKLP